MMTTSLLAGASVFALLTGVVSGGADQQFVVRKSSRHGLGLPTRQGDVILYDQAGSATSYDAPSNLFESGRYAKYDSQGADDFIIPGTAEHRITAVYANGQNAYGKGHTAARFQVTFYKKLRVGRRHTRVKVLASCPHSPASDPTGDGTVLIDVSSCGISKGIRVKGGVDYSLSVQAITPAKLGDKHTWYWGQFENQIGTMAWWQNYGNGFGFCTSWQPIRTCFPTTGHFTDLIFEIIGK